MSAVHLSGPDQLVFELPLDAQGRHALPEAL
jgi:hypothetical protein